VCEQLAQGCYLTLTPTLTAGQLSVKRCKTVIDTMDDQRVLQGEDIVYLVAHKNIPNFVPNKIYDNRIFVR